MPALGRKRGLSSPARLCCSLAVPRCRTLAAGQVRLSEAQAATAAAARLEADNAELVRRLMELKAAEIERMNDMNRMMDELVS